MADLFFNNGFEELQDTQLGFKTQGRNKDWHGILSWNRKPNIRRRDFKWQRRQLRGLKTKETMRHKRREEIWKLQCVPTEEQMNRAKQKALKVSVSSRCIVSRTIREVDPAANEMSSIRSSFDVRIGSVGSKSISTLHWL
jgi:hypothetical protein